MKAITQRGIIWVLAASVLWGTTGTAAAQAPDVGPLAIGAAAMGIGGLLQGVLATGDLCRHRAEVAGQWRALALSSLTVALYPLAFYSSMRLAGVAVGTVISIGSAPVAAAIIERLVDGRPFSRRWMLGTSLAMTGLLALTAGHLATSASGTSHADSVLGAALGLFAGFTYATYSWGAARMMRAGVQSRLAMGTIFGIGGLLLLPVLLVSGASILQSGRNFAVVSYMALVPMFIGYLLFGRGLASVTASVATTLSLLEPAVATLLAVLVLHERLALSGWLGLVAVFAGLLVITVPQRSSRVRVSPAK